MPYVPTTSRNATITDRVLSSAQSCEYKTRDVASSTIEIKLCFSSGTKANHTCLLPSMWSISPKHAFRSRRRR
jgi:hypothetical protein